MKQFKSLDACDKPNDTIASKKSEMLVIGSQSLSIEYLEKQPPQNHGLAKNRTSAQPSSGHEDKLKLDTHDTSQSPDPAGLFSNNSVPSFPAVDNHVLLKSGKPRKNKFCFGHHNCTTCKHGNTPPKNICNVCMAEQCCYERL